ncbi:MAG: hypothetical protein M1821_000184 [Bathelium mastoideum]|nr:MAG: hypothetical protein M1821_000184 [Bathelium mastoideum]
MVFVRLQSPSMFAPLLVLSLLARTARAACACGYSVNSTSSLPNAIFTELFESDFLHLDNISTNGGWIAQVYNVSAVDARGPFGKSASLANVVTNPVSNKTDWAGPGQKGGDPGLQLWVRANVEEGMIGMGEIATQRRDILYGSIRVGMKISNIAGTCGAFFWVSQINTPQLREAISHCFVIQYFNNSQEIDVEFLSRDFVANNNSVNLVVQSPASQSAAYNAAGTPGYHVIPLPFAPDDGYHEYRFDWLSDQISFYADGSWLANMDVSIPNSPGALFLNHWSNGDPNWSGGPPASDAVMTVSYVKAYFNTSDESRNNQYAQACIGQATSQICLIPDQTSAPDPTASNGNTSGNTFFFTQQPNMTVNQTLYPGGTIGESSSGVEVSVVIILSSALIILFTVMLI